MKLLLVLAVIAAVWWWLGRSAVARRGNAPPAPPPQPQPMLACSHCGLHLPHHDAVAGGRGAYCCAAHRTAAHDDV